MKIQFGDLPVGAKFRLECWWCEKTVPRICERSRAFYGGKTPGYPSVYTFHDWNARYKYMNHGDWCETSLSPETLVEML